jgi:L-rhamnose 1-dehydrogenase
MVLHHLGDSTLSDVKELEQECAAAGAKSVIVAGDIANEQTAKDVSHYISSSDSPSMMSTRLVAANS